MILYSKDSRNSTRWLLDVINIFNKVVDTKSTYKKAAFFYINNEIAEEEIRKIISLLIASQSKLMYLKINLMKERKDLHDKNFKTLEKDLKRTL